MRAVNANAYFNVPADTRYTGPRLDWCRGAMVFGCARLVLFLHIPRLWRSELYWFA